MASTSSSIATNEYEKKKEGDKKDERSKNEYKDMHVKLDNKFIEYLKNKKIWPKPAIDKSEGILTKEQIEEMSKRTFDFDNVVQNYLMDEEIVWEEDVWGLKKFIEIPKDHAKVAKNN